MQEPLRSGKILSISQALFGLALALDPYLAFQGRWSAGLFLRTYVTLLP